MNINEMILEKVRNVSFLSPSDGSLIGRLTQVKDGKITTGADSDKIEGSTGTTLATIYKAKTGEFSATNAFFSTDLLALQLGSEKEQASASSKILVPAYKVADVASGGTIELDHTPVDLKYIYGVVKNQTATKYSVGASASDDEFAVSGSTITVPTSAAETRFYIEYEYESADAQKIRNKTDSFPTNVGCKIYCLFKDVCDEALKTAVTIVSNRAKIDPSQVEIALSNATEGHAFSLQFEEDFCDETNDDLFTIIISPED